MRGTASYLCLVVPNDDLSCMIGHQNPALHKDNVKCEKDLNHLKRYIERQEQTMVPSDARPPTARVKTSYWIQSDSIEQHW